MLSYIYSIKDRAADAFMSPWVAPHVGVAARTFSDEVNRGSEQNNLFHHPDDFELYEIGTFDSTTGVISAHDSPKSILQARAAKQQAA